MKMNLSKKLAAALLLVPVLFIGAFMVSVLGAYGSFSDIPHHDVVMWTFWAVVGLLIVLVYAVILVFVVNLQDGSYLEISDDIMEEPIEQDIIFDEGTEVEPSSEELTEEEAPEELQVEAPELSEMNIDELEPEEHAKRKEAAVESPQIWEEEEFE